MINTTNIEKLIEAAEDVFRERYSSSEGDAVILALLDDKFIYDGRDFSDYAEGLDMSESSIAADMYRSVYGISDLVKEHLISIYGDVREDQRHEVADCVWFCASEYLRAHGGYKYYPECLKRSIIELATTHFMEWFYEQEDARTNTGR